MAEARRRIVDAVLDLASEHPLVQIDVAAIVERAGVRRSRFEECFGDREECFVQVYREGCEAFLAAVLAAYDGPRAWRDRLRAAAYAGARFLRDHPRRARFNVVHILGAGDTAMIVRDRYHQRFVDLVDEGRGELDDPDSVPRATAEGVIGSIVATTVREVSRTGGSRAAEELVPELMYVAVRPYLGEEAAREELTVPPPRTAAPASAP